MKKTILSLLSMAFISAMTLTSCDEIMSKMDNPVDSYLKVDAEVFVKEGSAVELYAETISDAEVTYTVGDEKIAKVEKVSNHEVKVIGVKPGETVIDVKLAANAYYKAGEAKVKVVVDPTYTLKDAVVDGAKLKIGYKFNGEDYIFAYGFDADKKEFNALDENNVPKAITNLYDITITYDGDGKITQKLVSKKKPDLVPFVLNLYTAGSFDRIYKLPIELKSVVVNNYDVLPYVPESVTPVDQLVAGLLPDNMEVGDKGVYPISFFPDNATNQVIKYTSSDPNVITIDAAGNIEAKAAGTATIKAEATDGTGKFVQHTITVAAAADLKTIILEPNIWDIDGAPDGWFGDLPQYNTNQGADYDSGYEKMYGDRDINDEYFSDSDYRFKNDEWEWDLSPEDRKGMVDDRFNKDSVFNKAYTESRIHRIVKESVNKILKKL